MAACVSAGSRGYLGVWCMGASLITLYGDFYWKTQIPKTSEMPDGTTGPNASNRTVLKNTQTLE